MRRLHLCAQFGDAEEVEEILQQNDPFLVNCADELGQTALHFASSAGQVDVAKVLLQRGANVNTRDIDGGTPLSQACSKGLAAIVDLLLKFGADSDTRNNRRHTPLHCAAMAGATEVFKLLVEFGANFNAVGNNKRTPLDCPHLQCPTMNYILVIERHMTKMASARLPYTKLAFYRPGVMDLDAKRAYRKECVAELTKLEDFTFPDSRISLRHFLTRPDSVHRYIRNPDICEIVTELDFITDYPIYSRLLEHNLFKGLRRAALLESTAIFFSSTQPFSELPPSCFEKVCSFLDDRTLSYLGLVWAWSQSQGVQTAPSVHVANSSVVHMTNHCMEACMGCSMASMASTVHL